MVKLISITPNAEQVIAYCARVSNPENQKNYDTAPKLLSYCIKHGHWSVFEMANIVMEIETGRDIAPQILRHRSFVFQEFSQRYSVVSSYVERKARKQDPKNRQNSTDDLDESDKLWFEIKQKEIWDMCYGAYKEALDRGISKESARSLMPLNTATRLYMNGTVRSWIHYIQLRTGNGTQAEHRDVAEECKTIFCEALPDISKALGWIK